MCSKRPSGIWRDGQPLRRGAWQGVFSEVTWLLYGVVNGINNDYDQRWTYPPHVFCHGIHSNPAMQLEEGNSEEWTAVTWMLSSGSQQ
jgi:hypothetical protein